jgi:hypothetical protein
MQRAVEETIDVLERNSITASQFILSLLTCRQFNNHHVVQDLVAHSPDILTAFLRHPSKEDAFINSAHRLVREQYITDIRKMSSEDAGWHFGASSTTTKQLEDFSIEEMAQEMETSAPTLWNLLGGLLGEDRKLPLMVNEKGDRDAHTSASDVQMSVDDSYWDQVDAIDLEGFINGLTSENGSTGPKADRRELRGAAIISIVSIIVGSH